MTIINSTPNGSPGIEFVGSGVVLGRFVVSGFGGRGFVMSGFTGGLVGYWVGLEGFVGTIICSELGSGLEV